MVFISPVCCLAYNFSIKKEPVKVSFKMVSLNRCALFYCSFFVSLGAQSFHQGVILIISTNQMQTKFVTFQFSQALPSRWWWSLISTRLGRLVARSSGLMMMMMMMIYIYYDEVSVCVFVCKEKSSLPSWAPEARSEMFARPCRP